MNIYNIGVLFPEYFAGDKSYFHQFNIDHNIQNLTESNKGGFAYRKGIYLSNVIEEKDGIHFNLLRCSTNLQGPTENFSALDKEIITNVNMTAKKLFPDSAPVNHVLAQIYYNRNIDGKDRKAKIAKHSDKTKDMPSNGLMVFCSFYDITKDKYKPNPDDKYDLLYKNASALTTLKFALKDSVQNRPELRKNFSIKLYPNSAFFMDLESNRLYTHEIVPPLLPSEHIPARLGYVIRSSNQEALFTDRTFIKNSDVWEPLEKPTKEDIAKLKSRYLEENLSSGFIKYDHVNFSLNDGDYLKPNLRD